MTGPRSGASGLEILVGLACQIMVAPGTLKTDCKLTMNAHAPQIVGNSREPFKANWVFASLLGCFPFLPPWSLSGYRELDQFTTGAERSRRAALAASMMVIDRKIQR